MTGTVPQKRESCMAECHGKNAQKTAALKTAFPSPFHFRTAKTHQPHIISIIVGILTIVYVRKTYQKRRKRNVRASNDLLFL